MKKVSAVTAFSIAVAVGLLCFSAGYAVSERSWSGSYEIKALGDKFAVKSDVSGRINVNTATRQELEDLPSIGSVTAQRIIDYREVNGEFAAIEELLNVKGIGEKTLEKLKEYVTLASP